MRLLVLLAALAMPIVGWLSQTGAFGPDQAEISSRYPLLLQPAGYAFSIWSLIFLLDIVYALRQITGTRRHDALLARIAPAAAIGFACTTLWMPAYAQEWLWICVALILLALASLLWAAAVATRGGADLWTRTALALHAGWLSVAAFLNIGQALIGAGAMPPGEVALGGNLALLAAIAVFVLAVHRRMRGDAAYAAAAAWGLIGVTVALAGRGQVAVAGWAALAVALVLGLQTVRLRMRGMRR